MNRIAAIAAIACLVLASALAVSATAADVVRLPEFRIKDQFGRLHTSGSCRNAVVVLLSGDRKGNDFVAQWQPALRDSVAGLVDAHRVVFIRSAHLKGAPFFVKGKIRSSFSADPGQWVLLDYDGVFGGALDLPADVCAVAVFDRKGCRTLQIGLTAFDAAAQARIIGEIRSLAGP